MGANLVYFVLPTILMILGFPIYLVLILTSLAAIVLVADVPLVAVPTYMFGSLDNFPLLAVPYFVLAGEIMFSVSAPGYLRSWSDEATPSWMKNATAKQPPPAANAQVYGFNVITFRLKPGVQQMSNVEISGAAWPAAGTPGGRDRGAGRRTRRG